MRNIALKLMYNGTAYHGWQVQKTEVYAWQETLDKARSTDGLRPPGEAAPAAGRTDAGRPRRASMLPISARPPRIPMRPPALRRQHPHCPRTSWCARRMEVPDDFNAIGSCLKKEYTYRIYNSRIGQPVLCGPCLVLPQTAGRGGDAARRRGQFVGTHDFRAVRSVGTETKTTVRTVHYCRVTRRGELIWSCKVCADGFLYNMVRAITGTVLYAAEGKLTAEDIPEILDSGDRTLAGPTVPPGGLYMTRLWYEDERLND